MSVGVGVGVGVGVSVSVSVSHLFFLWKLMRAAAPPTANTAIYVTFTITWTNHRAKHTFKASREAVSTVRTW